MNREQIIQMARDAGFSTHTFETQTISDLPERITRLCNIVRAATKDEDAKICDMLFMGFHSPHEYSADCAEAIRASK